MAKFFYPFLIPGGLILAAAVAASILGWVPAGDPSWLYFAPEIIGGAGLLLGWRFNRSRLVLAFAVLLLGKNALVLLQGEAGSPSLSRLCAFLIPLNLAFLSVLSERGLLNARGLLRIGLLIAQVAAVVWLWIDHHDKVQSFLEKSWIQLPDLLSHLPRQPLLLSFLLSSTLMLWRIRRRPNVFDAAFFWALSAAFIGCLPNMSAANTLLFFCAAETILLIGLLESSHFMAFRDELTGLPGRRALNESLMKIGSRFTLAMVDIDHFKKINDMHGHDVGDQVLRMVAAKLNRVTGGGRPFRYGGEEFTIIFPGKTREEVHPHLENLRLTIAESDFILRNRLRPRKKPKKARSSRKPARKINVTVSIGAAEKQSSESPETVFKRADQVLYKAKKGGRNQVRLK